MLESMVLIFVSVISFMLGSVVFNFFREREEKKQIQDYFRGRDERFKQRIERIRKHHADMPDEQRLRKDKGEYIRKRL